MEKLLASQSQRIITLNRGQQVEGEVVSANDKEVVLDLGAKSEGILQRKELPSDRSASLKSGDKIKAYVSQPENESGQVVLSLSVQSKSTGFGGRGDRGRRGFRSDEHKRGFSADKFIQAKNQKSRLSGTVLEVNKGGLIVDVEGVRGFLPNSQVGFELLSKSGGGMESLIGQNLNLTVIEVDSANNKLIFSQRGQVSDSIKEQLKKFQKEQKVSGKIVAILPFGLVVDVSGVEGLVFISDVAWDKVEDLSGMFKIGQEIEVLVTGIDESLGRLNLSIKQLSEDPFGELAEKYLADEVVKGEVLVISDEGVAVKLKDGVEGFLPASKMKTDTTYEVGKSVTLLIDSVDSKRRRVNLAPFVTSTEGLIYK